MPSVVTAALYPSLWAFRPPVRQGKEAFIAALGPALALAASHARDKGLRPPESIIGRVEWALANKDQEASIWKNLLRPLWLADWFEANDKPETAAVARDTKPLETARAQQKAGSGPDLKTWFLVGGVALAAWWWLKR